MAIFKKQEVEPVVKPRLSEVKPQRQRAPVAKAIPVRRRKEGITKAQRLALQQMTETANAFKKLNNPALNKLLNKGEMGRLLKALNDPTVKKRVEIKAGKVARA